ncbi:MAG: hypothetical protein Q9160_006627 [Pyrenula sp. 1 TL-2023]
MPRLSDGLPSSPPSASASSEEALAYYKTQYEQLEAELADFQNSSRELEAELERDIEASEKRERQLKEKSESLGYEVEEWKAKYKQAKIESGSVQNNLQKEITTLRDSSRTFQLKLRDIEVQNDDFERQARNTESSLEDMESKYSVAIERSVMLEEEVKLGEQEREGLRIESQRLRDELSDLKIEADITREKLRNAEQNLEQQRQKPTLQAIEIPDSPLTANSPSSTTSSPFCTTPPAKSNSSSGPSDAPTPPSPPFSENSANAPPKPVFVTPVAPKTRPNVKSDTTPRPSTYSAKPPRHTRRPSIPVPNSAAPATRTTASSLRQSISRPSTLPRQAGLPSSNSVYQLRNLRGKMANLEARVHNARSKLPAPVSTPPRASPRSGSALGHAIPNTVTVRNNGRRRAAGSTTGTTPSTHDSKTEETTPTPQAHTQNTPSLRPRPSITRLSMGAQARNATYLNHNPAHPPATPTRTGIERPQSRTSAATPSSNRNSAYLPGHSRPGSRASISNLRAPQSFAPNASTDRVRPTSSLSSYSNSNSNSNNNGGAGTGAIYGLDGAMDDPNDDSIISNDSEASSYTTPTPRRSTFGRTSDVGLPESAIPTPFSARSKRDSFVGGASKLPLGNRRVSSGLAGQVQDAPMAKRPGSRGGKFKTDK